MLNSGEPMLLGEYNNGQGVRITIIRDGDVWSVGVKHQTWRGGHVQEARRTRLLREARADFAELVELAVYNRGHAIKKYIEWWEDQQGKAGDLFYALHTVRTFKIQDRFW